MDEGTPGDLPPRRLTLGDGIVLVAGTALGLGLWIWREQGMSRWGKAPYQPMPTSLFGWFHVVLAVALALSWVVLIVRLRPPRPALSVVASQPGFVACLAVVATSLCGWFVASTHMQPANAMSYWETLLWSYPVSSISPSSYTPALVTSWLILVIGGRWRPEASWVDRLGIAIGATVLLMSLISPLLIH